MLFTAFAFFAALVGGAYAAPASGRTAISAPQGHGQIIVSQTQLRVTGCLNASGLWNVAGDCATFTGDEEGGISGPEGYLLLTEDGITTSTSSDTTWLGYYFDGNSSAKYISADKTRVNDASGQILLHADHVPSEAETVPVHASAADNDVAVYLSWIAQ
ncbi:hypothetical protein KVR01_003866 [Diaporthe batatas]|uniref:uncharacterized protein n=1 Tax=Diaporthe batatas TaxID=748121 RepID=UPI001D05A1C3|nr:uncharacterized protein KVR01_003866 [Diaporthe batatas]KAG8168177.1 hypothetical protein KVR01_003866 [Diaporthe batatas]